MPYEIQSDLKDVLHSWIVGQSDNTTCRRQWPICNGPVIMVYIRNTV